MPKDPVCGMSVSKEKAFTLQKDSKTYYFCSKECREAFIKKAECDSRGGGEKSCHGGHAHMVEEFKRKFFISSLLSLPVLFLSEFIQSIFNYSFSFGFDSYFVLAVSTVIFFYGGKPFLTGTFQEVSRRQPGMMTLIGLAITVAYFYSTLVVLGLEGEVFFWELVTLIDIMLLGHWIEMRSVMGASKALEELARLLPDQAHLLEGTKVREVKISELKKGDRVLVKPGEKIPVDGTVLEGESEVNEAMITGESAPVLKNQDSKVIGGSINSEGSLTVKVEKTGNESYLSQVAELVRKASESKSRTQGLANIAAFWLTMTALTVGALTLFTWLALGRDFVFALERMVTVMIITCPHALGLAIPLVIAVITTISVKNGILIRNRISFEQARKIDTVVFDKTGTLTKGKFGVTDIIVFEGLSRQDVLGKAAAAESHSEHSIARGIIEKAKQEGVEIKALEKFESFPGRGLRARVAGEEVIIGNERVLQMAGVSSPKAVEKAAELSSQGKTVVYFISGSQVQALIALADIIRDESRQAVLELKNRGIEVAMITGDNEATARYVSNELSLDKYFAKVLPEEKSEKIKQLQQEGRKVAMVGDGVNDAPALAQADVGIAIGAGTDVAIEAADLVLVGNDPRSVVDIISLSHVSQKKAVQNLAWATGYNIFAIPLAAGVLYKAGIILPPAIGALVMSLSTIIVAFNARLIRYKR